MRSEPKSRVGENTPPYNDRKTPAVYTINTAPTMQRKEMNTMQM